MQRPTGSKMRPWMFSASTSREWHNRCYASIYQSSGVGKAYLVVLESAVAWMAIRECAAGAPSPASLSRWAGEGKKVHRIVTPPSATIVCPVMNEPAALASITAMPPMSSGVPRRRSGVSDSRFALRSPSYSARAK